MSTGSVQVAPTIVVEQLFLDSDFPLAIALAVIVSELVTLAIEERVQAPLETVVVSIMDPFLKTKILVPVASADVPLILVAPAEIGLVMVGQLDRSRQTDPGVHGG